MADKGDKSGKDEGEEESPAKRRLEAIASVVGAALALGTIGIILWDGFTSNDAPPFVVVESRSIIEHESGFTLLVAAINQGGRTAAEVKVEGELLQGGEVVATSEATFDYVPGRSSRPGGLFFAEDPRTHEVRLRALGYIDP